MLRSRPAQRSRGKGGRSTPVVQNIFSRAVARATADGGRQAKIVIAGHSHVTGAGASTGTVGLSNSATLGFPAKMATKLAALGTQAECGNLFGDYNGPAAAGVTAAYIDHRLTLGSGWASDAGPSCFGGAFLIQNAGETGYLEFTPDTPFTGVRYWHPFFPGISGAMGVYVDDVLRATVDLNGAGGLGSVHIPFAGSKVGLKNNGGALGFFIGFEFDHAPPVAKIILGAHTGAYVDQIASKGLGWSPGYQIDALDADVGILYCMTNNLSAGNTAASWKATAKTIIQQFQVTGEAVLVIDPPASVFDATLYGQYAAVAYEIQTETGCAILDLKASFVSYANSVANGWQYDDRHPSGSGYDKIATELVALP